MKYISVLLTCYNRKQKTLACLSVLFKCTMPKDYVLEVFLVDDGCTDETAQTVQEQFPQVVVVKGDGCLFWNRGMHLAWNTAAKTKDYDYYLWLNDDVELYKDSLVKLQKYSDCKNDKSIIVGVCKSSAFGNITYSGYNNLKEKKMLIPDGYLQQCDYFNGNIVLIPKFVYKQVGNLDFYYHHDQGDFDYGLKAKQKDITSYVSGEVNGECERHGELPVWCNPKYSLQKRWKHFKTPMYDPKYLFYFEKKHINIGVAIFHYFTKSLRLLCPKIWICLGKDNFRIQKMNNI